MLAQERIHRLRDTCSGGDDQGGGGDVAPTRVNGEKQLYCGCTMKVGWHERAAT